MLAFLLNIIACFILLYVFVFFIKRRIDSSIIWYCLVSIFFINIPLLFDSVMILWKGMNYWETKIANDNREWVMGTMELIDTVSIFVVVFHSLLIATYILFSKHNFENYAVGKRFDKQSFLSWISCLLISYIGLSLFLYTHNITSLDTISHLWFSNVRGGRLLNLLSSILVAIAPCSILKMLKTKQYFIGGLTLLPVIFIGLITLARSQFISIVFFIMYFFVFNINKFNFKRIILLGAMGLVLAYSMTFFRLSEDSSVYPVRKDASYCDLFYSFKNQEVLTTEGDNFIRLVLTGLINYKDNEVKDVTIQLADIKYRANWGSLHPTIIGWAFIDLGMGYLLLALYFGLFLSICDYVRFKLPSKYSILFLSFIFSFIAVAVRGSVQFAYSSIIYPLFIVLIFLFLYKIKIICKYNNSN